MKILNKLSVRNLRLNKKRTISTIIGIGLCVALICAVASMGMSFQATLIENAVNESGYFLIKLMGVEESSIKRIENNRDVKKIYPVKKCGYAKLEKSQNSERPYIRLVSMDQDTFEQFKLKLIKGKLPENKEEVVISESMIQEAKVNYNIGDTINLEIGERKTLEDYELNEQNPFVPEKEKIVNTTKNKFKIVGIIEKPTHSIEEIGDSAYTVITTGMNQGKKDLYIALKSPKEYKTSLPELLNVANYEQVEFHDIEQTKYDYKINRELLRWEAFAFSDSTVTMLYAVIGVVISIILVASIFCIRNSFAIATTEKIKMYSMLASVGTTKKQIKKNVIQEGFLLGLVGIPLGIIAGSVAVLVLIKIVNLILGNSLLEHVEGLVFKISILPIGLSVVLGVLTIYFSARSSAKKASKVTPIEGLRSTKEIYLKSTKLKVPKIIVKLFKTGGVLAYKNLKRSKKKYRTTVISLAISIFIFITMNSFIANMFDVTKDYYQDFHYNIQIKANLTEETVQKILLQENIEYYTLLYNEETGNSYQIKDKSKIKNKEDLENEREYGELRVVALDSKAFERYAKEIGVSYEEVKQAGILCDEVKKYKEETGKTKLERKYTYEKGDKIEGEYKGKRLEIMVGAVSKIKPDGLKMSEIDSGYLIVDFSEYQDKLEFSLSQIMIQSNHATQLEKEIKKIEESIHIYNLEEVAKEQKSMILVIKIFLYGFIAVISLIGVTNIFNTITSNMELRQKEFAMLKSIGMTKEEFNRMINLETIFYGTKSWIYGTGMGLLGTFVMYKAFSIKMQQGMYIPINAIVISAVFVFIFVFMIMRYSLAKINKQNTIETIRKENI